MIWKTLLTSFLILGFFAHADFVYSQEAGQCSERNDCNNCPKLACDCHSYGECHGPGQDPGCPAGLYNGFNVGERCVGDVNCSSGANCLTQGCGCSLVSQPTVSPTPGGGATVNINKSCYVPGEEVVVTGSSLGTVPRFVFLTTPDSVNYCTVFGCGVNIGSTFWSDVQIRATIPVGSSVGRKVVAIFRNGQDTALIAPEFNVSTSCQPLQTVTLSAPPVYGHRITGRIFLDFNENMVRDNGEPFLQGSSESCGYFEKTDAYVTVSRNNVVTNMFLDKCNPEPYFGGSFQNGNYDVKLILPVGYKLTTGHLIIPVSLTDHDEEVLFGIAKELELTCPAFEVPGKICLGEEGLLRANSNNNLIYKWESGCLTFPRGNRGKEVIVTPRTLGSCEVKLAASINGVDFLSCGKKYVLLDDCKASCLSITSTPNIVKVGQASTVEVSVKGDPPFTYSWATPVSDCKIEGEGGTVRVTPIKLPEISSGSICPISVTVNGAVCSTNIGVVEDLSYSAYSWFKTLNGDVLSYNSISDNIPINEFFSDYLVKSAGASVFDFSSGRTGRERASARGWLIEKTKFSFLAPSANFFEYFTAYYPAGGSITKSEIKASDFNKSADYLITPDFGQGGVSVKEKLTAGSGAVLRFYVNGDLNIENDIETLGDGVVLFVVKRNLNISANVKQVSGAFLVDGTVNVTDRLGSTQKLVLNGLLAVSSKGKLFGLSRSALLGPSEVFIYEPKYLVKLPLLFNRPTRVWLEVSP